MKAKTLIFIAIITIAGLNVSGQELSPKNHIWSYNGKNKTHTLGLYGSLYGSYSPVENRAAQWYGGKIGLVLDNRWGIGIAGSVLNYDYNLNQLVSDGTYRLQAGFAGLFVEYILPVSNWAKFSISWTSGTGSAFYEYNKEFRESRPWYQEIIDTETFNVNEIGLDMHFRTIGKWWLGAYGSYKFTSPIELTGTDNYFLQNYSVGISVKYGIF